MSKASISVPRKSSTKITSVRMSSLARSAVPERSMGSEVVRETKIETVKTVIVLESSSESSGITNENPVDLTHLDDEPTQPELVDMTLDDSSSDEGESNNKIAAKRISVVNKAPNSLIESLGGGLSRKSSKRAHVDLSGFSPPSKRSRPDNPAPVAPGARKSPSPKHASDATQSKECASTPLKLCEISSKRISSVCLKNYDNTVDDSKDIGRQSTREEEGGDASTVKCPRCVTLQAASEDSFASLLVFVPPNERSQEASPVAVMQPGHIVDEGVVQPSLVNEVLKTIPVKEPTPTVGKTVSEKSSCTANKHNYAESQSVCGSTQSPVQNPAVTKVWGRTLPTVARKIAISPSDRRTGVVLGKRDSFDSPASSPVQPSGSLSADKNGNGNMQSYKTPRELLQDVEAVEAFLKEISRVDNESNVNSGDLPGTTQSVSSFVEETPKEKELGSSLQSQPSLSTKAFPQGASSSNSSTSTSLLIRMPASPAFSEDMLTDDQGAVSDVFSESQSPDSEPEMSKRRPCRHRDSKRGPGTSTEHDISGFAAASDDRIDYFDSPASESVSAESLQPSDDLNSPDSDHSSAAFKPSKETKSRKERPGKPKRDAKECLDPDRYRTQVERAICQSRAQAFKNQIRQCSRCGGCRNARCGVCTLCVYADFCPGACVFRCCDENNKTTKQLFLDEIDAIYRGLEKGFAYQPGQRVHCLWKENETYYWGTIRSKYEGNYRYTVDFDDGDKRENVLPTELISSYRYDLGKEYDWLSADLASQSEGSTKCCQCAFCRNEMPPEFKKSFVDCIAKTGVSKRLSLRNYRGSPGPGLLPGWTFFFQQSSELLTEEDFLLSLRICSPNGRVFAFLNESWRSKTKEEGGDVASFLNFLGCVERGSVTGELKNDVSLGGQSAKKPQRHDEQRKLSNTKTVGSRVYAKYSNGQYYWGNIEKVNGTGTQRTFGIKYEDDDELNGVEEKSVYTEIEYFDCFGVNPPNPGDTEKTMNLFVLFERKCGRCTMCKREACGKCVACLDNSTGLEPRQQACLLCMCSLISPEGKKQKLAKPFPPECYYFFVEKNGDGKCTCKKCGFCPYLDALGVSLRVVVNGTIFECWREAFRAKNLSMEECRSMFRGFFKDSLGQRLSRPVDHDLINKFVYQRWVDEQGRNKQLYGKITGYFQEDKGKAQNESFFEVEYFAYHQEQNGKSLVRRMLPERVALGAYSAYIMKSAEFDSLSSEASRNIENSGITWMVPETRSVKNLQQGGFSQLEICTAGFVLTLQAAESGIPGAGLGLWVSCQEEVPLGRSHFELAAGQLIDLGVYAPLVPSDYSEEHVLFVKSFLHDHKPESWSFDAPVNVNKVYDITNDCDGEPRDVAKNNILIYTNETDGKTELQNVYVEFDPEGRVHYLLGHRDHEEGAFRLVVGGEPVECKVDYGEAYEKVRVRKGYSRCGAQKRKTFELEIEKTDQETFEHIDCLNGHQLVDVLRFLQTVFSTSNHIDAGVCLRGLALAYALVERTQAINDALSAFDLGDKDELFGYTKLKDHNVLNETHELFSAITGRWANDSSFAQAILGLEMIRNFFCRRFDCSVQSLETVTRADFRSRSVFYLRKAKATGLHGITR